MSGKSKIRQTSVVGGFIKYFLLIAMAFTFAMPMAFTLLSSVKNKTEIFSKPFALPAVFKASNYVDAWNGANMGQYFVNSLVQAGSTVIVLALFGSLAAFALSRFKFKGSKLLAVFFMIGMMVPMHTVLVPVSYIIGMLELKNNMLE